MKTLIATAVQRTALVLVANLPGLAMAAEPSPAPQATKSPAKTALPANGVVVIEDDGARIEETRVRGQVVRVQVQSKVGGATGYEITVRPGGDASAPANGATGRSVWRVLSF